MSDPVAPRLGGVLETCLYASDLDQAADFYTRILGLREFARVRGRHVFFNAGRGAFLLFDAERTSEAGGQLPPHGARGPGHVAFAVRGSEIQAWKDRLARLGTILEAEVAWPAGGVSLYLRAPSGNSVELASPTIWKRPEADYFGPHTLQE